MIDPITEIGGVVIDPITEIGGDVINPITEIGGDVIDPITEIGGDVIDPITEIGPRCSARHSPAKETWHLFIQRQAVLKYISYL